MAPPISEPAVTPAELPALTETLMQEPEAPVSTPEPDAADSNSVDSIPQGLGFLTILNWQIPIADNVDENTLEKKPGWMPNSDLPGESGMAVILGHRNRPHFRVLWDVVVGDTIQFTCVGREYAGAGDCWPFPVWRERAGEVSDGL